MSPLETAVLKQALLAKGFKLEERSHHVYFFYDAGRKTHIRTKISHGKKEYDKNLVARVKRQLKLSSSQFADFIACPMTGEKYQQHLLDSGHVRRKAKPSA